MAYKGKIQILRDTTALISGQAPFATVDVLNEPDVTSDACGGGGSDKAFIEYKSTDYCFAISSIAGVEAVATSVVDVVNNDIPDLSATKNANGDGTYQVVFASDTVGTTDDGESIIFKLTNTVDPDGDVFSIYNISLSGGVDGDGAADTESIDIEINGSVFASFTLTQGETKSEIATNIEAACTAVGSGTYTFSVSGNTVEVTTTSTFARIALSTPSSLKLIWNSVDIFEI